MTNTEPTQAGWYRTKHGVHDWMVYALDERGGWSAHMLNGDATPCPWPYIDQAGEVELIAAYPRPTPET
jgi:hypothetical protein